MTLPVGRRAKTTAASPVEHRSFGVMAGADPRSTTCGVDLGTVVDGLPPLVMTPCRASTRSAGLAACGRALARWLLRCAAVLVAVGALCFAMTEALPGDTAQRVAAARYGAENLTTASVEGIRGDLGLDRPWAPRFAVWLGMLFQGDVGVSAVTARPVWTDIGPPLRRTMMLAVIAWPASILFGVVLGVVLARSRAGLAAAQLLGAVAAGLPSYVTGILLGSVFAIALGWLPVAGYGSASHLVLPAITLTLVAGLRLVLVTARAAHDASQHPSIGFARMKGLPETEVAAFHILPLAAPPVIAYAFIGLAFLLEGAAVVETVFAYPGIGSALVDAVLARDVPVIQGATIAIAILVVTANSLADGIARFGVAR